MTLFEEIIVESGLLLESAQSSEITDAILNFRPARIKYRTKGQNYRTGARLIYPVAFGTTKSGYPVVRAFQEKGETTTRVPAWKFFRVDRIITWKTLTKTASGDDYHFDPEKLSGLNRRGDGSMAEIYAICPIGKAKEKGSWFSRVKGKAKEFFQNIFNKKQDPSAQSEPVSKSQIKGSDEREKLERGIKSKIAATGPNISDKDTVKKGYASASDIVNDIIDSVANNVDKEEKGVYLNNDNPELKAMSDSETVPVTKDEVNPDSDKEQDNSNAVPEPNDNPVTKDNIEQSGMDKITSTYNDMMHRWGFGKK